MRRRLLAALPLFLLASGAASAQPAYQPPPVYEPPAYALPPSLSPPTAGQPLPLPPPAPPPPYAPEAVQSQPLPPPGETTAPSAELPLGPPEPTPPSSPADHAAEAAAIRDAIVGWANDFNDLKSAIVCNIFSPDLRYDFGDQPGDYNALCKNLRQALGQTNIRYKYSPDIREILISGDIAVIRLIWTLTITQSGKPAPTVVTEPAMYVMRHDPDGAWRVFRFLAFTVAGKAKK